jgi:hypothetical protein
LWLRGTDLRLGRRRVRRTVERQFFLDGGARPAGFALRSRALSRLAQMNEHTIQLVRAGELDPVDRRPLLVVGRAHELMNRFSREPRGIGGADPGFPH